MKLIKKESSTNRCISDRLSSSLTDKNLYGCLNRNLYNTEIKGSGTLNNDDYNWLSRGYYTNYDNSGIAVDIKLDYPDFYTQMNSLINSDWVNENTYYVISIINFYSKNLNKMVILRNTFELINNSFIFNNEIKISDLESRFEIWFLLAIVFSVFCLIFEFLQLKRSKGSSADEIIEEQKCFQSLKRYFVTKFERPSFFTFISKLF